MTPLLENVLETSIASGSINAFATNLLAYPLTR